MKVLITGGVKSGKSQFAEKRCQKLVCKEKPIYLATSEIIDAEMQQRIFVHQQRRQNQFLTVEEPLELARCMKEFRSAVLVECMSMWINNMLYHQKTEQSIMKEVDCIMKLTIPMILVINDVGMGVIPNNSLARQFVDISGKVAQMVGQRAHEVHFCVAGQVLQIK